MCVEDGNPEMCQNQSQLLEKCGKTCDLARRRSTDESPNARSTAEMDGSKSKRNGYRPRHNARRLRFGTFDDGVNGARSGSARKHTRFKTEPCSRRVRRCESGDADPMNTASILSAPAVLHSSSSTYDDGVNRAGSGSVRKQASFKIDPCYGSVRCESGLRTKTDEADAMNGTSTISAPAVLQGCSISSVEDMLVPLEGHLWKKNVGACAFPFRRNSLRFFALRGSLLLCWRRQADVQTPALACIDLSADELEVEARDGTPTTFELWPKRGSWEASNFSDGSGKRRSITLDAQGSEHTREQWIHALRAHAAIGIDSQHHSSVLDSFYR